jgi:predicted RNA-binding protein with PIN domain
MIIVVDAYNLLRATPPYKKTITEKERMQFIAQLSGYGRHKGHKIVIVFDGGPHEWPFKENMKIVQVVYSGIHESADDYIKEYIDGHKAKDLLLVSSDSELNRYAQHRNIPSIDSSTFAQLLHEELAAKKNLSIKPPDKIVKLAQDKEFNSSAQDVLDNLMMEASRNVSEKSEDFSKARTIKKDQLTKEERILLQKLKKL